MHRRLFWFAVAVFSFGLAVLAWYKFQPAVSAAQSVPVMPPGVSVSTQTARPMLEVWIDSKSGHGFVRTHGVNTKVNPIQILESVDINLSWIRPAVKTTDLPQGEGTLWEFAQ
jgi:hypothetical protein